jgi:ribosomal protein S18 acetylase RimI-like enzyme
MVADLRPFQPSDLCGVVALLSKAMPVDPISEPRFVRQVLLDPNFRVQGAPVARPGDEVAGFCLSIARQTPLENAPSDADRGYITLFAVAPKFQRQGIGTQLLTHAENYLRSQNRKLCMISPYAPGYFTCGVDVKAYAGAVSFFAKHGYAEVYRPIAMEIGLWDFAVPEWVQEKRRKLVDAGVIVEAYRSELTLPLLEFAAKEFAGDWVRYARETMGKIQLGENPARLMVAHRHGKVIGYSHFDNERFGPIGVTASERGRGLGHVLMYETLTAQRLAGFRTAWFLWSDDKTAARIYSAAGFKEVRRFALMKKELS